MKAGKKAEDAALEEAHRAKFSGIINAGLIRREFQLIASAQRTAIAANGIDSTTGSSIDVIADTIREGEIEAMLVKFGFESRARAFRAAGEAARSVGAARGISSILSGFGNAGLLVASNRRSGGD